MVTDTETPRPTRDRKFYYVLACLVVLALGSIYFANQLVALTDADFYECEPDDTLVVCKVGTGPPAGRACRAVGTGKTTIEPKAC